MRSALSILGYDASISTGQSFWIGTATTSAEQGIEDSVIKMLEVGRVWCISYMFIHLGRCSRQYRGGWYRLVNDSIRHGY